MRAAVLKQFNVPLVLEETPDPVAEKKLRSGQVVGRLALKP